MPLAEHPVQSVSQRRIEDDLDENRHCEQGDHERLRQNGFALESEQQYERQQ